MNGRLPFPELTLRVVDSSDLEAVIATYRGLSPQSMYRRFFTLMPDPAPLVQRQFSMLDHRDHEALVVLDGDGGGRHRPLGSPGLLPRPG